MKLSTTKKEGKKMKKIKAGESIKESIMHCGVIEKVAGGES